MATPEGDVPRAMRAPEPRCRLPWRCRHRSVSDRLRRTFLLNTDRLSRLVRPQEAVEIRDRMPEGHRHLRGGGLASLAGQLVHRGDAPDVLALVRRLQVPDRIVTVFDEAW